MKSGRRSTEHPIRSAVVPALLALALAACGGGGGSSNNVVQVAPFQGITKITIDNATSEAVTFGGTSFGSVGQYQKIRGTATGQIDPNDTKNSMITDIALAQRNAAGAVEYTVDFYILKPVDVSKGNHKMFYEVNNRGGKQFGGFNQSSGGNNPTTAANAGQAFLMNQGYTLVWSGWDASNGPVAGGSDLLKITVPLAKNSDGSTITGPSYEYIVNDNATTTSFTTYYNTASTDTTKASLWYRQSFTDTPVKLAATDWTWKSPNSIGLANNAPFKQSAIYELYYTAQDPYVAGVGFAAIRDFVSFLRNEAKAQDGSPNPLGNDIKRVAAWTLSQPGRLMNDYVWLGFNQDLGGRKVFDGVFNWIAAGSGLPINYRFAQSGRTERNRQNHLNAESVFPFSYTTSTDPNTGKTDGRNARCTASGTCPRIMNVVSGNEYWVKAGSLLTTDANGKDLVEPANVRNYYVAGSQHGGASAPNTNASATSFGACSQFGSGVEPNPLLRALWVALDQWLDGTAPPESAVPSADKGTAVFAKTGPYSPIGVGTVPQGELGFPTIPKAPYSGLVTVHNVWDFGPTFGAGVLSNYPGLPTGKYYANFVSKVDADGNDIAGIRLPEMVAPVATNSGWGLRSAAFGGKADGMDGCEGTGSSIVFAPTKAAREAIGDPRPSLEERYKDRAGLVAARTKAANDLLAKRLLLQADVNAYISAAANPINVVASPTYGTYSW